MRVNEKLRGQVVFHDYNDKLECIFVHIPKTAGTSLQKTLFNFTHTGHLRWDEYEAYDKKKFSKYYKFAFVRNPWDRVVSAYEYLKSGGRNESDKAWSEKNLAKYTSFESFINSWLTEENILTWNHFVPQSNFIFDTNDNLKVDFLGRFETLNCDFKILSEKLGGYRSLENINKSKRKAYKDYYSKTTKDKIAKLYGRDVELLGYKFDDK
ncbi:sulfotransferase family protein [Endozoicomonas sp. Mp262]|uniref:sulfotransferase family protein n=1 Tax=Endozoicomonas sp. Mp262 TaxID=2919499 RepID=UPI0021DA66A6